MEITIKSGVLCSFLERASCDKLVKDLRIQCDSDNTMSTMFGTVDKNFYGELICKDVIVNQSGVVEIPNLKTVIDILGRTDSESNVKMLTRETDTTSEFCITDGNDINKMMVVLQQCGMNKPISFTTLDGDMASLDKDNLVFKQSIKYENGFNVDVNILNEVQKDASAFGYENYKFVVSKKNDKPILKCNIMNFHSGEKFVRVLASNTAIGDYTKINEVVVGSCFKEVLKTIKNTMEKTEDKNNAPSIKMYIDDMCILLTDGKSFYYNIATAIIDGNQN